MIRKNLSIWLVVAGIIVGVFSYKLSGRYSSEPGPCTCRASYSFSFKPTLALTYIPSYKKPPRKIYKADVCSGLGCSLSVVDRPAFLDLYAIALLLILAGLRQKYKIKKKLVSSRV